jgi:hypothetical protein
MDSKVQLVHRVLMAFRVFKVLRALTVVKVFKAQMVFRVPLVLKALTDSKAFRVIIMVDLQSLMIRHPLLPLLDL